jgi:putative membrane protein
VKPWQGDGTHATIRAMTDATLRQPASARFALGLLTLFALAWVGLGISPHYREDWLLENILVVVAVPVLAIGWRHLPMTRLSYACLFAFALLHEIGAHYTYAEVPYDAFCQRYLGFSLDAALGLERNTFDRLVHFLYGVLVTPACVELLDRVAPPRGLWRYLMPVSFIMAHSMLFELFEWLAATMFGGDLGQAYLGTQGDIWDAHWDMALAMLGSILAVIALGWRGWLASSR